MAEEQLLASAASEYNEELARLYKEDQADRMPPLGEQIIWRVGEQINWHVVGPRDAARLLRVKELCQEQSLRTGEDYYHAAMILQHSSEPEDYLLAHELCIIAIIKGKEPAKWLVAAKWLAAASEDRYLVSIGRPQRFGTQYRLDKASGDYFLYEVAPGLSDEIRRAFNCPSLSKAQAGAKHMNKKPKP